MTAIPVNVPQNSPAWLDARREVIGSSDIPTLTGNSPYRTSKLALWAYKTRREDGTFLLDPEPPDPADQERFDLGHALEDDIAARCPHIKPAKPRAGLFVHPEYRYIGASLDRYNRKERVVHELKWMPHRGWNEGPEPVPAYVQDQVQQQTFVMGDGWTGHVTGLLGSHVECFDIEPDREYQENLRWFAERFHDDHIVPRIPPEPDGSEETRRTLLRLHPRDTLGFIEPTAEIEALVRDITAATRRSKVATDEEERLKNVLRAVLADAAGVAGDGWKVTFRKSRDSEKDVTDWQLVAAAYRRVIAELYERRSLPVALEAIGIPQGTAYTPSMVTEAVEGLYTQHVVKEGSRPLTGPWSKKEEASPWQ